MTDQDSTHAPAPAASLVVLRTTANPTLAGDWGLVLAAAGTAYQLEARGGVFELRVGSADATAAEAALASFDAEAPSQPMPPAPDTGRSALGIVAAGGLAAMYLVTGPAGAGSRWTAAGAAAADRILAGEWWRTLTALTLHADIMHLVGNVLGTLLFVTAVGRWLGGGLGAVTILMAAAGANFLTAAARRVDFVSVGASTATFAALGLVAGLQVVRRLRGEARRAYAWVPLGAGLGLYAMLGVGPGADTYAHLFGLGLGAALGTGLALADVRAPRASMQALLGAVAVGLVGAAWALALRHV